MGRRKLLVVDLWKTTGYPIAGWNVGRCFSKRRMLA